MARIPIYSAAVSPMGQGAAAPMVRDPTGLGAVAQGLAGLDAASIAKQEEEINARRAADTVKHLTQAEVRAAEVYQKAQLEAPEDAAGFRDRVRSEMGALQKEVVGSIEDERVKMAVQNGLLRSAAQMEERAIGFEAGQRAKATINSLMESADRMGSLALVDPTRRGDFSRLASQAIDMQTGITAEQKAALKRQASETISVSSLQGMVQQAPAEALAAIDSGEYADVDPQRLASLRAGAESGIRALEARGREQRNEANATLQSLVRDYEAAAFNGVDVKFPADVLAQADPDVAARLTTTVDMAGNVGRVFRAIPYASDSEVLAEIGAMKPSGSVGPGYAEQQQAFEQASRIAEQQLAERRRDPMAYLIEKNDSIRAAYEGGGLAAAANAAQPWLRQMGMPNAPVMPQAIAKAEAERVNKMSGGEQTAWIEQAERDFGSLWPRAFGQLDKAGIDAGVRVLAHIQPEYRPVVSAAMSQRDDLRKALPTARGKADVQELDVQMTAGSTELSALQSALLTRARSEGRTNYSPAQDMAMFSQAVEAVATSLMIQRKDLTASGAVKEAQDIVVNKSYGVGTGSTGGVIVPRKIEGRAIDAEGVLAKLSNLTDFGMLGMSEEQSSEFASFGPMLESQATRRQMGALTNAQTNELLNTIAFRESSSKLDKGVVNATTENTSGYLGTFQHGADFLADNGMVDKQRLVEFKRATSSPPDKSLPPALHKQFLADAANWSQGMSKEKYLASPDQQMRVQQLGMQANLADLRRRGLVTDATPSEDIAGLLMGAHLGGVSGIAALKSGKDRPDSNGTKVSSYVSMGRAAALRARETLQERARMEINALRDHDLVWVTNENMDGAYLTARLRSSMWGQGTPRPSLVNIVNAQGQRFEKKFSDLSAPAPAQSQPVNERRVGNPGRGMVPQS
jgi:hypothetical protein